MKTSIENVKNGQLMHFGDFCLMINENDDDLLEVRMEKNWLNLRNIDRERVQKDKQGVIFRCGYTPIIEFYKFYKHWGGISIGYAF